MKKKLFNAKAGKVLVAIGCLLLALAFWFVVKYGELGVAPIIG